MQLQIALLLQRTTWIVKRQQILGFALSLLLPPTVFLLVETLAGVALAIIAGGGVRIIFEGGNVDSFSHGNTKVVVK